MVDLVQTKDEDVQGLPKLVWVLVILFAPSMLLLCGVLIAAVVRSNRDAREALTGVSHD